MICLSAEKVSRSFTNGAGITDVDLSVEEGEVVALVGLNGAGKTTLMRILLGMLRAHSGLVRLYGQPLAHTPNATWASVGHAIDALPGYHDLTVRRNLEISAVLRGIDDRNAAIAAVVDEFHLRSYLHQRTRTLSMGNRQRAGLAAALIHNPRLIVLDEPTNSLDPAGVIRLRESLLRRASDGAAVLVSSHHLDEVARFADRIVVMNRGRLIGELTAHAPELERLLFETLRLDDEGAAP